MTNIWVMRNTKVSGEDRSTLVRADAISYLRADDHKVVAAELGSLEPVTLADEADGAPDGPLLPTGFHTDLLDMVSTVRRKTAADGDTEDHVLVAQVLDDAWAWRSFAVSEPVPRP
ncbi:hypothetical protein ACIBBE_42930 [Streptomyces sp. NPDC051644]|uniref:hypothetical protein n=1 Tax=Streptomyces sp. NPDC051644 TaxID=3365666 RepID=UPI0037A0E64E